MSLFKTFQKDRKIDTTPFDLSFQNLLTANFGGLTPLGSYPVLPKDRFKIGSNILTKVEPMPAPAFCRIKQNTYAFFTPNSTVWKHWNDYVTNGTAYADTYGNNSNNQKTDNQWRPPQVSACNIQLISKLANGWAIPIFRMPSTYISAFIEFAHQELLKTDMKKAIDYLFNDVGFNVSEYGSEKGNVYFSLILYALRQTHLMSEIVDLFDDIPYYEFGHKASGAKAVTNYRLDFGCDFVTCARFYSLMQDIYSSSNYEKRVCSAEDLSKTKNIKTYYIPFAIRPFSDNITSAPKANYAPFILEKRTYCTSEVNNRPFNYYVYRKNIYEDNTFSFAGGSREQGLYVYRNNKIRKCGYFWSCSIQRIGTSNSSTSGVYLPSLLNGVAFNPAPVNTPSRDLFSEFGFDFDNVTSISELLTLHNYKNTYNEIFYDTTLTDLTNVPTIGSASQLTDASTDLAYGKICPFSFDEKRVTPRNTEVDGLNFWTTGHRLWNNYIDIEMPLFYDSDISRPVGNVDIGQPISFIPFTYESYNLGYDAFSLMLYLCKNCVKLLDYYNIPLEGLTARSWSFYANEYIKMLPFFGYSKIWNDYFRNKTTSTAELDYSETNSEACCDRTMVRFLKSCRNSGIIFPSWKESELDLEVPHYNGWSLPFDCSPKNSMSDAHITISGTEINLADISHFHDLRIRNYWMLFSLLTGAQLYNVCLNSIVENFDNFSKELYGILADKLYLPSYYNGLLHYKYQNFNKDYFSSALLDPAAGANDEQIGDTVSSLVTAQAKQGFWNRLANNRSVKQFWNSVFGIDPSHDEYDKPLLLGSAHTDVNIGEVVQLSQTDTTPQGQRSGLGSAHDKHGLCNKQFNEHGYVLILLSHTLELQYMQGLEKDWTPEESFLDLPFIDFVGLGNQSINQRELNYTARPKLYPSTTVDSDVASGSQYSYMQQMPYGQLSKVANIYPSSPQLMTRSYVSQGQPVTLDTSLANGSGYKFSDIFGYIPRYSTWKFKLDQCHGEFRNSLDFWHAFRRFFTQPILCHEFVNWEFMSENDELGRMFFMLDDSTDKFKIDAFINCTAYRPLPYVCVPTTSKS